MARNSERYRKLALKVDSVCEVCGTGKQLLVHHKDENPENDELCNLEVLCRKHHYSPKVGRHRHLKPFTQKHKEETKGRITETLKKRWKEGRFDERVLPDRSGVNNPMYGTKANAKQLEGLQKGRGWNKGLKFPGKSNDRKRDETGKFK